LRALQSRLTRRAKHRHDGIIAVIVGITPRLTMGAAT
jgi:hypothetical protein